MSAPAFEGRVVCLCGGVGGARLVDGLAEVLPPGRLTAIVNTGDDFRHWGLWISPDLDTVLYTLAGLADPERGWGLRGEGFGALEMMRRYGGEAWFALGDGDLATHLLRTEALARGERLTAITADLSARLGVASAILPMADAPCPTRIEVRGQGILSFQDWLVRAGGRPEVRAVSSDPEIPAAPGVLEAIEAADLVVLAPSNPFVSLDPILLRPGLRAAVARRPVVAVSPIVGGRAVKGPLAAMIPALLGVQASAAAVLGRYADLVGLAVVETGDAAGISGPALLETATVMGDRGARIRLAAEILAVARRLFC